MIRLFACLLILCVACITGCSDNKGAVKPTNTITNKNMSTGVTQAPTP